LRVKTAGLLKEQNHSILDAKTDE